MKLELYREYTSPTEEADIKELTELTLRTLRTKYVQGPQQRDTHAKGLAMVKGVFTIEPNLPQELRVGLFAKEKAYHCVCRFSNTDPDPKADIENDVRAISIKLMGVEGEMLWTDDKEAGTMDILMMTSQVFLTPDIRSFISLQTNLLHVYQSPRLGNLKLILFFLTHPGTMWRVLRGQIQLANLLEVPYFSETAYRFGDKAVQYKLSPHKKATSLLPGAGAPNNFLNDRLREDLAAGDVVFDFMVHIQVDAEKMPIEDASVPWSDTLSPPKKVATLRLSKQDVAPPALHTTGEFMTFNPWRTLPEHRPLGWCNRVRLSVYRAIAEFRHSRNGMKDSEPRVSEST